ncbi:H(+) hexose cotransporter 2 isoform B [Micractinium conductrix]|uniref:H(+) hexose cotransporter 2 isoform B n=1 Tax=Micractinium conductrix TaxID=554055 RepID=A0A2P6VIZ6_9CHLO|nr:H(+) hexose cotransporter 2 isoform B [Micractinium conductrix]|eukprot:PSC74048.1 H(+) hexose cotransporter 2 isoform B [Micractinium conductrix]
MASREAPPSPFKPDVLSGRVALVTGGGSGIGLEIVRQLGLHGAHVVISGRREAVLAEAVAALGAEGITAHYVQGDVRRYEDCERTVEGAVARFGRLDILVNCAAGNFLSPAEQLSSNGFRTVLEIDTLGTFNMCRAAFAPLKAAGAGAAGPAGTGPGALIINISMTLHYGATWWQAHASAAKAAVDSLTRSLGLEWGLYGIRTAGVAPGPIEGTAGMTKLAPGSDAAAAVTEMVNTSIPLGHMGRRWDIAQACVFLASPAAAFVTGHTLVVDGAEWLCKQPLVPRAMVTRVSRGVEAKSRAVGLAGGSGGGPRSKLRAATLLSAKTPTPRREMAGGGVAIGAAGRASEYKGGLTAYVVFVAVIAASGGLLFGYDLGVTGGVEASDSFLSEFFPSVYESKQADVDNHSPYCTFNDQGLALFTSSLFLAGMLCAPVASVVTRKKGRKVTMLCAGILFLIGASLNASAQNLGMLITGRIFLGLGMGAANQSVPLYLSEMSPSKHRGAMNILFQLATTIGVLTAQLVNYAVRNWDKGWRLSLGLAGAPAIMLTIGGLILPDSPNSLIERGHKETGRKVLEKIRGTQEVDAEYEDMCDAALGSQKVGELQAFKNLTKRPYRPAAILAIVIPTFQQWTGMNAIMFYVPILFSSLGTGDEGALINAVIIGAVNLVATVVAIILVDRAGRRALFLEGGVQMLVAQVAVGILLGVSFSQYNTTNLPSGIVYGALVLICIFVAGFAWSWGPLGWLIPSEVQPLETRSAGYSHTVLAGMTIFVFYLVPETKGIPLEEIYTIYCKHKVWRRVIGKVVAEAVPELEAYNSGSIKTSRSLSYMELDPAYTSLDDDQKQNEATGKTE